MLETWNQSRLKRSFMLLFVRIRTISFLTLRYLINVVKVFPCFRASYWRVVGNFRLSPSHAREGRDGTRGGRPGRGRRMVGLLPTVRRGSANGMVLQHRPPRLLVLQLVLQLKKPLFLLPVSGCNCIRLQLYPVAVGVAIVSHRPPKKP